MVLIFELNTTIPVFVPVILHGTADVIPTELNTICSCHLTPVVGQRFLSRPRSSSGNMQLPYNSPGGYLVHVLFSQFVFFSINGPGWTSGKPW